MSQPDDIFARAGSLDDLKRFVRVTGERGNGFVEFDFAIGEPNVCVEMILGREAFDEFCAANRVEFLPIEASGTPESEWDWRMRDATAKRFK